MWKIYLYLLPLIFAYIFFTDVFAWAEGGSNNQNTKFVNDYFELLETKHGSLVDTSLFALEDIRPFNILHNEKSVEMYDGQWKKPVEYLNHISKAELEQVKFKLKEYLGTLDTNSRLGILQKIDSWCNTYNNLINIKELYGLNSHSLMQAINRSYPTDGIISKFGESGEYVDLKNLTENQKAEAFYDAINMVSGLSQRGQFNYFSELYKTLSQTASTK